MEPEHWQQTNLFHCPLQKKTEVIDLQVCDKGLVFVTLKGDYRHYIQCLESRKILQINDEPKAQSVT